MSSKSFVMAQANTSAFRPVVTRMVWQWTASAMALAGAGVIGGATALQVIDWVDAGQALAIWLATSAVSGWVVAKALTRTLAAPLDALFAMARADDETLTEPQGSAGAMIRAVEGRAVRSFLAKNGRIAELQRARDTVRSERGRKAGFLAGISHELRTPLNAIIGYATLLSEDEGDSDPKRAHDLERILQSSRHLLRLINDLLDLSRLDADSIAVDCGVVDVNALLTTVKSAIAQEVGEEAPRITIEVAEDARILLGDATRLRQCLVGLGANVLDANPGQDVTIQAGYVGGVTPGVKFRVNDPGGRLAAAAERDPEQAERADSALALAVMVTRRLATLMGGSLSVERTARGGGSLVLFAPINAPTPEAITPLSAPALNLVGDDRNAGLVLVIDDDLPTIDLLRRWLSGQGYEVIGASNGQAGLELARTRRPQFIILDIFMPGQSGYEVMAELKADPELGGIPVIIASSDDNRRMGLQAGAAEVMVKPLTRQKLKGVMNVLGDQVSGDILVVDDDPDVREIVQRHASQAGLTVRVARNGAEGLEVARAHPPRAIILDLWMPDTDGFAMLEALAADPDLAQIPVMVLSQLDLSAADHARIRKAGHSFRPKWEFSPAEIVESVKAMVAQ